MVPVGGGFLLLFGRAVRINAITAISGGSSGQEGKQNAALSRTLFGGDGDSDGQKEPRAQHGPGRGEFSRHRTHSADWP